MMMKLAWYAKSDIALVHSPSFPLLSSVQTLIIESFYTKRATNSNAVVAGADSRMQSWHA